MNSKIKKALCVAVAGASLVGALSGCSNSKEVSNVVTYWAGIPMGDGSSDAETPVTDGGDAATDETPADNTTTDEPPAADNTTTDETPATGDAAADATPTEEAQTQEQTDENKEVDKQEGETPTETAGIVLADAEGNQILDQDGKAMSYTTLEEAVAGAEAYSAAHPDAAVYIQLTESIELDKTITVSGKVNIRAAKAGVIVCACQYKPRKPGIAQLRGFWIPKTTR